MRRKMEASTEMPFLDHLEELRWRVIWCVGAAVIGTAIGFVVATQIDVVGLFARPVLPLIPEHRLVYTHPNEAFTIVLNASLLVGFTIALPMIAYQAWRFLAPALYRRERRLGILVLTSGTILFGAGAAIAFFVVIPLTLPWLFNFGGPSLVPLITAEDYFGFAFEMIIGFGLCFEMPIVVLGLSAVGIVTPRLLRKYRRHAIVAIWLVGAFATPGDAVSTTIALSVPLYALFEVSVAAAAFATRDKSRRQDTAT